MPPTTQLRFCADCGGYQNPNKQKGRKSSKNHPKSQAAHSGSSQNVTTTASFPWKVQPSLLMCHPQNNSCNSSNTKSRCYPQSVITQSQPQLNYMMMEPASTDQPNYYYSGGSANCRNNRKGSYNESPFGTGPIMAPGGSSGEPDFHQKLQSAVSAQSLYYEDSHQVGFPNFMLKVCPYLI